MTDPYELAGVKKKSFAMYFGGGEIWFEHLDGIYEFTDIAVKKLEDDFPSFKKPSSPSLIDVNVDETLIDDSLIKALADKLVYGGKLFTRVEIVGADKGAKRKLKKALCEGRFALKFINDFEKAKEWLVSESVL